MTTMAEVASEAGVSITTVSHVLNQTRHVNAETVERVRAAIERTGYEPHPIARALAGARTQSIGLAISEIANPYMVDFIAAIESEASRYGHTLLLGDTHDEPEKELQMARELTHRRVDGLILAPSPGAERDALPYLAAQSTPLVLLDRFLPLEVDQVGTENKAPAAELVEHLAEVGHRRIGLVAGLEGLSTTEERIAGYLQGLHRCGLPHDPRLVASGASQHGPAMAAANRLLDIEDPPTALIAANSAMTIGVMHALRGRGLEVPGEIALVAFDDFEWSDLFRPRLTVIAQPTREIGAEAVRLLLARLEDPDQPARKIRFDPTFIHRESCGCHQSGNLRTGRET
ncbi:MAG TPA: LacI family DNA-binding transcriptional regulator [Solirubrobacterales bacterium]|jgi:LacI family transcriptional regulator